MNINQQEGSSKEVWIGLVNVKANAGVDFFSEEVKGAYVNIMAWASSISEYQQEIEGALSHYGLKLESIENVEPLSARLAEAIVDESLLSLAEEVKSTGKVRFGIFHEYENEDKDRENH